MCRRLIRFKRKRRRRGGEWKNRIKGDLLNRITFTRHPVRPWHSTYFSRWDRSDPYHQIVCTFAPSHLNTQSDILTDRVEWIPVPDTLEGHICIPKFGKIKTRRENHKGNFHETSYYREVFPLPEKEGRGGDTEGACEDCWWYGVSSLLREGVERVCWFFRRLSSTAFCNTYVFFGSNNR